MTVQVGAALYGFWLMPDKRCFNISGIFPMGSSFSHICASMLGNHGPTTVCVPLIAHPRSDPLAVWRTPDRRIRYFCLCVLTVALKGAGTAEPLLPSAGEPQRQSLVSPRRGCSSHGHRTRRYLQHRSKKVTPGFTGRYSNGNSWTLVTLTKPFH